MTPEMIDRINQLAKKQRTDGLTVEETAEQALLRRQYIDHIKAPGTQPTRFRRPTGAWSRLQLRLRHKH